MSDQVSERRQSIQFAAQDEKTSGASDSEPSTLLTGKKLVAVFVALMLSIFVVTLDQTILATALPRITSDFDAFSLQGWVSTSFILTQSVFLLFYGQILRIFPAKWVLVTTIAIFEIGSLLCALSQNIGQLIAGRTISGAGGGGLMIAMIQVLTQATRLEDRPKFFGAFGGVFALSSILGPLIGGSITDRSTWARFLPPFPPSCLADTIPRDGCNFWLSLPLGGVSICGVLLLLKAAPPLGSDPKQRSASARIRQTLRLDFLGAGLAGGAVVNLILALQWGGNTKPWSDKAVIICFVLSAVLSVVFIAWSVYLGDRTMMPTSIFSSRVQCTYAILIYSFLNRFSFLIYIYYIPIFYQAARAHSATKSGIDLLPLMLGLVLTGAIAGGVVAKTGYYWPVLVVAPCFLALGSGLLYTLDASTSSAKLVGFQILAAIGIGLGFQNGSVVIQAEFNDEKKLRDVHAAFGWYVPSTIGLGIAEPIFASPLAKNLRKFAPDAPVSIVEEAPTAIYSALPKEFIPGVVHSYTDALKVVFVVGVPAAGMALIAALFIKNIRIVKTAEGIVPANAEEDKK
ncbi:ABC transporter [Mycena metata]|uniref:ABC transporter n=1 Tax=Mycena metata TaxID=1033252 RepID=A0AAD7J583_9AGAR|nr:ABC transporter [Mycena metata]